MLFYVYIMTAKIVDISLTLRFTCRLFATRISEIS